MPFSSLFIMTIPSLSSIPLTWFSAKSILLPAVEIYLVICNDIILVLTHSVVLMFHPGSLILLKIIFAEFSV